MELIPHPEECKTEIARSGDEDNAVLAYWGFVGRSQFWGRMADLGKTDDEAGALWDEAMRYIRSIATAKNIGWNAYHWTLKALPG